jgi:ATP-dependent Clp protease ATP-binding subunit ClpC
VMGELKKAFRPEFLNRLDEIIVFRQLTKEDIKQITVRMFVGVVERMAALEIKLIIDDSVADKMAQAGFDPVYGARPLRRAIQNSLEDELAEFMLSGKAKPRDVVYATVVDDKIEFRVESPDLPVHPEGEQAPEGNSQEDGAQE